MCGIRDDYLVSLSLPIFAMIFLNASHRGEFTLCAGNRLQCDLIHAGANLEHLLHLIENRE